MDRINRLTVEREQRWLEEIAHIPYIQFPVDWKIQIIPPFGDAIVRFKVELPCGTRKSVYLDSRSSLGCYGYPELKPYWEVYPYYEDVGRCDREDVEQLLALIADTAKGDYE